MADDIINIDPQFLEERDLTKFAELEWSPYRSPLNDYYRILENTFNPNNPTSLSIEDWAAQQVVETALDEYGDPIFITRAGNRIALKEIGPDKYVLVDVNDPLHKKITSSTITESMSLDIRKLIYNNPKVNVTRTIIPLYSDPKLSKPRTYSFPWELKTMWEIMLEPLVLRMINMKLLLPTLSPAQASLPLLLSSEPPSLIIKTTPKITPKTPKKVLVIQQTNTPILQTLTPVIESDSIIESDPRNPIWDVMNTYVPIDSTIQLSNNNPYSYVRPLFWEVDIKLPTIPILITTLAIPPLEAVLDTRTAPVQYPTFDYNDDLLLGTVISTMPDPELKIIPMVLKSEEVVIPKPQAARLAPDLTQYITPGVLNNFDLFMKSALGDSEYQDLKKNKKYKEMRKRFKEEQKILDDRANVNRYFLMREEQFKKLKNG